MRFRGCVYIYKFIYTKDEKVKDELLAKKLHFIKQDSKGFWIFVNIPSSINFEKFDPAETWGSNILTF